MLWFYITIAAYFFLAIAILGDKLILSKYLFSPRVYTISVTLLQSIVVILLPFVGEWPGWQNMVLNFAAGAVFVVGIWYFFSALKNGETSRVVPVIDGFVPIVVLILSNLIFSENFIQKQLFAIILLIAGGFILSYYKGELKDDDGVSDKYKYHFQYITIAVLAFAVSQIFAKITYTNQPFLSAFIWARAGGLLAIAPFLFLSSARKELKSHFNSKQKEKANSSLAVIFTQISGGIGFFLQHYAIKLGRVEVVIAMQGLKYFFLFVLIVLLSKKFVQLKEVWNMRTLIRKICGAMLVVFGLMMLI